MKRVHVYCSLIFLIWIFGGMYYIHAKEQVYDAGLALAYAEINWNSTADNDCANFVSHCLSAGGYPVDEKQAPVLLETLKNNLAGEVYTLYADDSGRIKMDDYIGRISPGDPVFWENSAGTITHAVLCAGTSVDGYMKYYAHSKPHGGTDKDIYQSGSKFYVVHMSENAVENIVNANPGAPYPIPGSLLSVGSTGEQVCWVQACLNALLGVGLEVDGDYGNLTKEAVMTFQQSAGLLADGIVGAMTRQAMLDAWRAREGYVSTEMDIIRPEITNVSITNKKLDSYTIVAKFSDENGISKVQVATWTSQNGQDDLILEDVKMDGTSISYEVKKTVHGNETGKYISTIFVYDTSGNYSTVDIEGNMEKITVPVPVMKTTKINKKSITIRWKKNKKVKGFEIVYSTDKKFKKNVKRILIKKNTKISKNVKKINKKKNLYIKMRAYKVAYGQKVYGKYCKKVCIKKSKLKKIK